MAVKVGDVAYLRTTDEPSYVLEVNGDNVKVRRPIMTNDGIKHLVEDYVMGELETTEEAHVRKLEEMGALKEIVKGQQNAQAPGAPTTKPAMSN